jgi:LmbE family N-acetylglucosaminyl deacetylase
MLLIHPGQRVLAIGAHPDDIELGAGGLIHRLRRAEADVRFLVLTAGVQSATNSHTYPEPRRRKETEDAAGILDVPRENVEVLGYSDCRLHEVGHDLICQIEARLYKPDRTPNYDVVLTHAGEDTHADHRAVHEATLSAVRDFFGTVLLYQAPSTKPNGFRPSFFATLDQAAIDKKDLALMTHISQREKPFMKRWRTEGMSSMWALFLRLPQETRLEAFEVFKSFC